MNHKGLIGLRVGHMFLDMLYIVRRNIRMLSECNQLIKNILIDF